MAMATPEIQYYVTLRLEFGERCDASSLEDYAVKVLEAIEEYAGDVAKGPVVGGDFEPSTIEIDFRAAVSTVTEVHEVAARVVNVIEEHTEPQLVTRSSVEHDQRPLVLA